MHELPITESLLEIALRHANSAHARQITGLHIAIGKLASVVDESVQFYWDIVAKGTIAEGARLYFRRIPVELECLSCHNRYLPEEDFCCPVCASTLIKVLSGEEFNLEALDIET